MIRIVVRGVFLLGQELEMATRVDGWVVWDYGVCLQRECDHLEGVII
jgi:hypothetical protein